MHEILVKIMKETGDAISEFSVHMYVIFAVLFIYLVKQGYWQKSVFVSLKESLIQHKKVGLGVGLLAAFSLLVIDKPVKDYFVIHEYDLGYDLLFKFGKNMGDSGILFGILVTISIAGFIWKKDRLVHIISIALMSSAFASLLVLLFKVFISRERPDPEVSHFNFFAFSQAIEMGELFKYKFLSMPSGHNVTIFSAMTPLFLAIKKTWIKWVIVIFTVAVGFSRVAGMQHWVSDTVVGASLGIWVGVVFYRKLIDQQLHSSQKIK